MHIHRFNPAIAQNLRGMVLLGVMTPLLPFLGVVPLLSLALVVFALETRGAIFAHLRWGSCILAVLAASALATAVVLFPTQFAFEFSPFTRLHLTAQIIYPPRAVNAPIWGFLRMLIFVLALSIFSKSSSARADFGRGIYLGLFISALVGIAEILGLFSQALPHRGSFWQGQQRYASLFSDPNACGVFLAISLPFLAARRGGSLLLKIALILTLFILGLFTGSRSFALALVVMAGITLWTVSKRGLLALLTIVAAAVLVASLYPALMLGFPSLVQRVWQSLSIPYMQEAFFSRTAFAQLALSMWLDNPLFGVGADAFRQHVHPYAELLKLPLGLWSDNSNNFYLGVLAETGIFGAVAWLLLLLQLRWRQEAPFWSKLSVISIAVLLFTGPHFVFSEVALFSAFVIGSACSISPIRSNFSQRIALALCLFGAGIWYSERGVFGLYDPEQADESIVRWTDSGAITSLVCRSNFVLLGLRATNPDIASSPVKVKISGDTAQVNLVLANSLEEQISFACAPGVKEMRLRISVDHTWQPIDYALGNDSRRLGVQIAQHN